MAIERRERNEDGSLGPLKKVNEGETTQEKIDRLEAENAQLMYNAMMNEMELESLNQAQAELTYQLMMKGVL